MFIFPWRKPILEGKLKEAPNIYVGAALIVLEGLQTIVDVIIFLICLPLIIVLTPYRIGYLRDMFKNEKVDDWRGKLFGFLIKIVTDIPYHLMLLVITLSGI